MGLTLVAQSATKYLAGHSDVVAGVLTGKKELLEKIFNKEYLNIGAALAPQNAWLLLRGLRTLEIRLEKISETADRGNCLLTTTITKVDQVLHPFSSDSKDLALAKKQMKKCGGLFSIVLKDAGLSPDRGLFATAYKHILMAVSWGGYESLVIPACAGISKADFDPNQ
jgi:cystathionine beta-lyase/cystathionine gamma-synthase